MDTNHVSDVSHNNSKYIAVRLLRKFYEVSSHRNFRVLIVIHYVCSIFQSLIRNIKYVFVRKTNKMHIFPNYEYLFQLNYPLHQSPFYFHQRMQYIYSLRSILKFTLKFIF